MNENIIVKLEKEGTVTTTFRKLDPDKKARLYRTALNAFSLSVFDRVSFDSIAEGAEVSKGSLFQYFGNKENLLRFVSEIYLDDYSRYWQEYVSNEHAVRARDRLTDFFSAQYDFWQESRREFAFYLKMLYENDRVLTSAFADRIRQIQTTYLAGIIMRGSETGEIRRDIESSRMAPVLLAVMEGIYYQLTPEQFNPKKKNQIEELINSALSSLIDGIRG